MGRCASLWCDRWLRGHSDAMRQQLLQLLASRHLARAQPSRLASVLQSASTAARFSGEESPGKSPARGSAPSAAPASHRPRLAGRIQLVRVYNLRATAFVSAPEEISACYSSHTAHETSTEPTSAARGPLTGEIGLAMSMGCESLRARALAQHRFQFAGGDASEACENAAPACGDRGTHSAPTEPRPSPSGASTDAAAALRPAHTL